MTQQEQQHEYVQSLTIQASPDTIFAFVSDVRNLPRYVPTTRQAAPQEGERVWVQGEARGHAYEDDGFLRADRSRYRLEWGSDEGHYAGELQITPFSKGSTACEVTVRIWFRDGPQRAGAGRPSDAEIKEGLLKALQSIRNQVTGQGGKEEPRSAS